MMPTSLPPGPAVFVLLAFPDGSRQVIELEASVVTLRRDAHDTYRGGLFFDTYPGREQVTVEGYVGRRVEYAPGATPDFTPTPQAEIEAPRSEIER